VTYSIENLAASRSDGSGDGFFITAFELIRVGGHGVGKFVQNESTCPVLEAVPVRAGEVFNCTVTIRLQELIPLPRFGGWNGTTFEFGATIQFLDSSWAPNSQPSEQAVRLREFEVVPAGE